MIKISVLYQNAPGAHFDMDYYCNTHMPLVQRLSGPAVRSVSAELGVSGGGEAPAPYIAVGHLLFESLAAIQESFMPHVPKFMADVPNYTNAVPVLQISEVKL